MQPQDPQQPIQPTTQINPDVPQPVVTTDTPFQPAIPQPPIVPVSPPSTVPTTKKSRKSFIIVIVVIVFIVAVGAFLLLHKNKTPQNARASGSTPTMKVDANVPTDAVSVKTRDEKRVTDINNIQAKLAAYYAQNGAYAALFTASSLGINATSLQDPIGNNTIKFYGSVKDKAAAMAVPAPASDTSSTAAYMYIPYPTDCVNNCKGYVLKSFIEEASSAAIPSPYVKASDN